MTESTPRLRVLFVSPEKHLLVIDRADRLAPSEMDSLIQGNEATAGTLIFPFEVDIPDDSESGIEIHGDEEAAIRAAVGWLRGFVDTDPSLKGMISVCDTLDFLLTRIAVER